MVVTLGLRVSMWPHSRSFPVSWWPCSRAGTTADGTGDWPTESGTTSQCQRMDPVAPGGSLCPWQAQHKAQASGNTQPSPHHCSLPWFPQAQSVPDVEEAVPGRCWDHGIGSHHPSPWPARATLQLWDPRGVPRRCSPVQATAAPASREQRPRTVIMDDVRPGHKQGG